MSVSIDSLTPDEISEQTCERWNALAKTPLQTTDWMLSWWKAFQSRNARPIILRIQSAGETIGIAPMLLRNCWSFGHTLRFLGSGTACTDYQTLLAANGYEQQVADAVAEWLISGEERASWEMLELEGVSKADTCIKYLVDRLAQEKTIQQTTELESTWRLNLSDGWDAVLANMSKSQRSQTRNLLNRFDKNDAFKLRLASTFEEIEPALESCIHLHQLRWQAVGKPGCFADPRFEKFVSEATCRLAKEGRARINLLEQNGIAVASQLAYLDDDGGIFVYQSGRDPSLDANRVGQILTLASIRNACDLGAPFIDFLRGDEIYKSRLKAQPFGCQRIRIYAPGSLPRLRYGAWKIGRELKGKAESLTRSWARQTTGR